MKPIHILFAATALCALCSCATTPHACTPTAEQRLFDSLTDARTAHKQRELTDAEYAKLKAAIIQKYKGCPPDDTCTGSELEK